MVDAGVTHRSEQYFLGPVEASPADYQEVRIVCPLDEDVGCVAAKGPKIDTDATNGHLGDAVLGDLLRDLA
jgi:hypothetical protein